MKNIFFKGDVKPTPYPPWVMSIAISMILAGVLPIPVVFLLRRYQILKLDVNIHEGSIRRIDTTVSTKEMITDVDVSSFVVRQRKSIEVLQRKFIHFKKNYDHKIGHLKFNKNILSMHSENNN